MPMSYGWGDDLLENTPENTIALESIALQMDQGNPDPEIPAYFKPVNISIENGLYYATIYACKTLDDSVAAQQLAIWFKSLKETDEVHLTVMSLILDIPLSAMVTLMAAVGSTKAKIYIHLDHIVFDSLAYFYLLANIIAKGSEGALFVPSYVTQRDQDHSGPWKATHDFFKWIVENAVTKNLLTEEEASKLHRGSHVVLPDTRFTT